MAFIAAVAAALWLAGIDNALVVVVVMLFAFLIAATIEWFSFYAEEMTAWRTGPPAG
jgi:hypothetical protein